VHDCIDGDFMLLVFVMALLALSVDAQVVLSGNVSATGSVIQSPSAPFSLAPPYVAVQAGFSTPTFQSFLISSEFDIAQTYPSGTTKKWYFTACCGTSPSASSTVTFNSPTGAVVGGNNVASTVGTAGIKSIGSWVGTAFGGGGYFEAVLYFSSAQAIAANLAGGWPAWWMQPIETLSNNGLAQWTGQATGYSHQGELDIMEYDLFNSYPTANYGATVHDDWGIYNITCSAYCGVTNGPGGGSNFSNAVVSGTGNYGVWHRYGVLWIPATSGANGSITYYFDGQPVARVTYSQYSAIADAPPPGTVSWTFGVADVQHFVLMLSTGTTQPMTVGYVGVWQASSANNITQ
jgi:hypothetical protein